MKKIHQVLVILLDNALKYTNPEDKIILDSSVNHKEWLIHVKNTGPSISEEDQARIFDRFYREDQSRAKETGGYGLGLAIAKQVIEQHHGQISVSNYLPQGVDFKVQLPLKPKNNAYPKRAVTKILSQPFLLRINGVPEVASSEISRNFFKLTTSVTTSLAYAYDFYCGLQCVHHRLCQYPILLG